MQKHLSVKSLLFFCAVTLSSPVVRSECGGCLETHLLSAEQVVYKKNCMLKQKHITGPHCPRCHCPKKAHSVHKHPYKTYQDAQGNTRKLIPQHMQTIRL